LKSLDSPYPNEITKATNAAVISITGHQGNTLFARQAIKSFSLRGDTFQEMRLDFVLSEPVEVSFTVQYTNKTAIQLDGIKIIKNRAKE